MTFAFFACPWQNKQVLRKHRIADKILILPNRIRENLGKSDSQAGFYDLCILSLYQMDAPRLI